MLWNPLVLSQAKFYGVLLLSKSLLSDRRILRLLFLLIVLSSGVVPEDGKTHEGLPHLLDLDVLLRSF